MWKLNFHHVDIFLRDTEKASIDVEKFQLKRGINVLTGENGIGKSIFMRLLAGTVEQIRSASNSGITYYSTEEEYGGAEELIADSPNSAIKQGIRAVYQDDTMFSELAIWEHFEIYGGILNSRRHFSAEKAGFILRKFTGNFSANDSNSLMDVWHKKPSELSMGQKAIVKLAIALYDVFDASGELDTEALSSKVRILLLDEILASVSKEKKAIIINVIKELSHRSPDTSVLVITHDPLEILSWQPSSMINFLALSGTNNRERAAAMQNGMAEWFCAGVYDNIKPIPIYGGWDNYLNDHSGQGACKIVLIYDKKVKSCLPSILLASDKIIEVEDAGEPVKQHDRFLEFLDMLANTVPYIDEYEVVVVGGGALINTAGHALSLLHRGRVPVVYMPSTIVAACDVAIGSKTGVSLRKKHQYGSYFNPKAIIIQRNILELFAQSAELLRLNLVESYKHAVLQDPKLRTSIERMIASNLQAEWNDIYYVIRQTTILKSKILAIDPYEKNVGKALLFGHLHARVIEELTSFRVPHDVAVWIGLYIDLNFNFQHSNKSFIEASISYIDKTIFPIISKKFPWLHDSFDEDTLSQLYLEDTKHELKTTGTNLYVTIFELIEEGEISTSSATFIDVPLERVIAFFKELIQKHLNSRT